MKVKDHTGRIIEVRGVCRVQVMAQDRRTLFDLQRKDPLA